MIGSRTRGKGKLNSIAEELHALRERVKLEDSSSKDAPIEIPASPERIVPMAKFPEPTPAPSSYSPETMKIRRALKSLSLHMAERDFCEASSERSGEIANTVAELSEPSVLDMEFDSLLKRSVFASFQALHFSSAAARAYKDKGMSEAGLKEELSDLRAAFHKLTSELDAEKAAHAGTLLEFEEARAELRIAKDSLKSLDGEMLKLVDKLAIQEKESTDAAVQYSLMARIAMLLEPPEVRASWDVKDEIKAFKLKFPESNLEDWGVPEVEDTPEEPK